MLADALRMFADWIPALSLAIFEDHQSRGVSSAGRAFGLQPKGREFEPRTLHVAGPGLLPGPLHIRGHYIMTRLPRALSLSLASLLLLLVVSQAMAHVRLLTSSPASGEVLTAAPPELRLVFSEPVEPALSSIVLLGPAGDTLAVEPPSLAPGSDHELIAAVRGRMAGGDFVIVWRTVSADGHPVSGRVPFILHVPPDQPRDTAAPVPSADEPAVPAPPVFEDSSDETGFHVLSPGFVVIRWLGYAGLLGLFGTVAFLLLLLPATAAADPEWRSAAPLAAWRARRWGVLAGTLFLLLAVARLVAQGTAIAGPLGVNMDVLDAIVLESAWGRAWIIQVAAGITAVALVAGSERRWALLGAALLLPLIAAAVGVSGHAMSAPWPRAIIVASHTAHLLGVGVWLGTLMIILLAGFPSARDSGGGTATLMGTMIRVFSPLALACGGLVVLTGVLAAAAHLGSIAALWQSEYGRTLLIKLAVVLAVGAVGAYNWRRAQAALAVSADGAALRRSGTLEVAFAAIVLLVTAVLVATPPPV
jgi:copper transport protein